MVLTTFPEDKFPARVILEWYRFRWQIELVFKRFKQIAQVGTFPSTMMRALRLGFMASYSLRCLQKR